MLLPFADAYTEKDERDTPHVPEVVPMSGLDHDAIEAAEAEIESEEDEWQATV
jgi:hypothetical protein